MKNICTIIFCVFLILTMLTACSDDHPLIVGVWDNGYGLVIEFRSDGTYVESHFGENVGDAAESLFGEAPVYTYKTDNGTLTMIIDFRGHITENEFSYEIIDDKLHRTNERGTTEIFTRIT